MKLFLMTAGLLWQAVVALGVLFAIGQHSLLLEVAVIPVLAIYAAGSMIILARMP